MLKKIIFFFFILFCCSKLFGQSITVLSNEKDSYLIGKSVSFYLDSTRKEELSDILLLDKKFQASKEDIPNWGFTSAHIWIKIEVQNTQIQKTDWYLSLDFPTLSRADFYFQNPDKQWQVIHSGNRVPYSERNFKSRGFVFPLELPSTKATTFYLKLGNSGPIQAPLAIHTPSEFYAEQMLSEAYYGIFAGIFLLILLTNLFFWINLEDSTYFYYIVYTLGSMLTLFYISGHTMQHILGNYPKLAGVAINVSMSLIAIGLPLFSKNFLQIKNKFVYLSLYLITLLGVFILLYNIFIGYSTLFLLLTIVLVAISTLFAFIVGIISLAAGKREARFFVAGFGIYFVGISILVLRIVDFIPINLFTNHVVELASVLEIIIMSLALSDKHKVEKKEAMLNTLRLEQRTQQNLEIKVKERTRELVNANQRLRQKDKVLSDNIEELRQIQVAMDTKQKELEQNNKILHFKTHQINSSIAAAEHIQKAMLPYKGEIQKIVKHNFIIYRPKDVVSGDFYWVNQIEGKKIIATVDCTGHGVPGAFMSLIGKKLLDKIVKTRNITDPAEILSNLHQEVRKELRQKYTNNNYGMDMALVSIEKQEQKYQITFSGAKTSVYYVSEGEDIQELKGTRKGIGGKQNDTKKFTNQSVYVPENTTIYMGTDGLQDQHNGEGKKLGSPRLKEILFQNSKLSLEEQKNSLEKLIDQRLAEVPQRDDILLFACKINRDCF